MWPSWEGIVMCRILATTLKEGQHMANLSLDGSNNKMGVKETERKMRELNQSSLIF
jgi:hypothetical protein